MAEAQQGNTEIEQRIEALDVKLDKRLDEVYEALGQRFAEHRELALDRFEKVDKRFDAVDARLDGIDGRLDGIDGRLDGIDGRLDGMDGRLDGIDGRLDGMDGRLDGLGRRMDSLDNRLEAHALDTTARFDRLEQKLDAFVDAQASVNQRILKHLGA
jgi:tetrahydromethanopterin S-methyltransferase subunit G